MAELPTGTVTFLFTDIEGSTRLWEQHPEAMESALTRHDALLTEGIQQNGGLVVKSRGEGDSLFAVFARAVDAVAAACALQRALCAEPWPGQGQPQGRGAPEAGYPPQAGVGGRPPGLRVRMALHTGDAALRNGDYLGAAVNRCARLRAAAHGGQVLLSGATQELVQDDLPAAVSLRDLGLHRLRDLRRAEHVFQLLHPDLPADFPPLQSLDVLPNNLPTPITSFIGREKEMAEVKQLLADTRLLTLAGSGGTGKTRLALQVVVDLLPEYGDGVWLVELAPLADPHLVPQAVAMALGIREEPGLPLVQTLLEVLKPKRLLLVLDNCEHLLAACATAADTLLRGCPGVRLLATSREALNIAGETTYRLPSLSLPAVVESDWLRVERPASADVPDRSTLNSQLSTLLASEAVRLFIDRASAVAPSFSVTNQNAPAVAEVCRRLDGIPLAIELAAARTRVLSVEQIAARLDDRFRLLTGGSRTALPRQQTLRALIDWSYDLLSEEERALFRRLSVFAGGWTLEAAEAVCAGEAVGCQLSAVSEDSPIPTDSRQPTADSPVDVLDLLTQLVDKSLVVVEEQGAVVRYRLLETVRHYARDRLLEAGEGERVRSRHLGFFLALAEEAEPKLRGPEQKIWLEQLEGEHDNLRAALEWAAATVPEAALRLVGALWYFWWMQGYVSEGRDWLERTLTRKRVPGSSTATAARAKALCGSGCFAVEQGDMVSGRCQLEESLAICRGLGEARGCVWALALLTIPAMADSPAMARPLGEESLAIARQLDDPWLLGAALTCLGEVARWAGDNAQAAACHEESVAISRRIGDEWVLGVSLHNLACVRRRQGDWRQARALAAESLRLLRDLRNATVIAYCLAGLAGSAAIEGQPARAARLLGAAEGVFHTFGQTMQPADRAEFDRNVSAARAQMDDAAFAAAWDEGRAMSLAEAVSYALEEGELLRTLPT